MGEPKRSIAEFVVVTGVGLLVAVSANAVSPRGLTLTRNYFPRLERAGGGTRPSPVATQPATQTAPGTTEAARPADPQLSPEEQQAIERITAQGLQVISDAEVLESFEDPQYQTGSIVFVDARKDEEYLKGHIPQAHQVYHYEIDKYIGQALPAIVGARKVVVYCNGGDCDDSEFTAVELLKLGADQNTMFVYPGGITRWRAEGRPIEKGQRGSGDVVEGGQ